MLIADFRQTTAVLLLNQQPAMPARSAIASSDGPIIRSLAFGSLGASKLGRRKKYSATSVPDGHRKRSASVRRIPSSAARDSELRLIGAGGSTKVAERESRLFQNDRTG